MPETRNLTAEEWADFAPVFEKIGVNSPDTVRRFVDTRLDKIYDVFLLNDDTVLKKSDRDREKYERYFAGHDFSIPLVVSSFQHGDDCWVSMPLINGSDARDCSPEEAGLVGGELAKIQSYYLGTGLNPDGCRSYFERKFLRYWEKSRKYFPGYDSVFETVRARFFSAPRTLVHDDFLPINALLDGEKAWLIDWTYADILPYFLDLGRFSFVSYEEGKPYIPEESAKAFLDTYYEEMSLNPQFVVTRQEFSHDVAKSAFCQNSMFVSYKDEEKVQESEDYIWLGRILRYLDDVQLRR